MWRSERENLDFSHIRNCVVFSSPDVKEKEGTTREFDLQRDGGRKNGISGSSAPKIWMAFLKSTVKALAAFRTLLYQCMQLISK